MNAINARCSSLLFAATALLLSSCAPVSTQEEPRTLQMSGGYTTTGTRMESVLKYAGDPAPSGQAEFATVTDSAGNTLFEEAIPPDKTVTVSLPSDGKLFVSTRWSDGRTQQEMSLPAQGAATPAQGGNVTIKLNEATLLYSVTTLSPAGVDTPEAAKPTPEEITVEDVNGEILYWGFHRDVLEIDATDDTMICTIKWSDRKITSQEISLTDNQVFYDESGEYVIFVWDGLARQYSLKTHKEPQFIRNLRAALIELEAGTFGDKPTTAGVVTGGAEEPLLEGSDEIDYQGFNLGLTFGKWKRFVPSIELGAVWGDGDTSRELAGVNSGWAYQGGLSPDNSPGLASMGGTRASLETEYERQIFSLSLSDKFLLQEASQASLDYTLGMQRSMREYRGEAEFLDFPAITSTDRQEITEYDLGLGFGLRGRQTFPNKWALSGLIGVDAIYYRGKYTGNHLYECKDDTVSACTPTTQEFSQSTDDKVDGFTWGVHLTAKASYQIKTNGELYLGLDYRYQDEAPVLQNRVAPGDPEPYLDTNMLDRISLRLGFNQRY